MPRSHRYDDYSNQVDEEEEEEVICPYNKEHRIRVSEIQHHLALCKKAHNGNVVRSDSRNGNGQVNRNRQFPIVLRFDANNETSNTFEDNRFERNRFDGAKQRNGHGYGHGQGSFERDEEFEIKSGFGVQPKQSNFNGQHQQPHVEQFAAPKGFKIAKGFGGTKEQNGGADYGRDRTAIRSRDDHGDRYDDSSNNYVGRPRPYVRSKSNLEAMDEDTIRRAQRHVVDQVREFQTSFNQRPSTTTTNHRELECERFTKLRDPPSSQQYQQQQPNHNHDFVFEERTAYGRGRKIVEPNTITTHRPGLGRFGNEDDPNLILMATASRTTGRLRSSEEKEENNFGYKDEPMAATAMLSRFTITKASNIFGHVEVAEPARAATNGGTFRGMRATATIEEEDWGSTSNDTTTNANGGGHQQQTQQIPQRTFVILKPSDVFNLDPSDDYDRRAYYHRGGGEERPYFNDHHGRGSFNQGERRFNNRRFDGEENAPRFSSRPRTPTEIQKPVLPWPFNRFAENPNLGRRRGEEVEVIHQTEQQPTIEKEKEEYTKLLATPPPIVEKETASSMADDERSYEPSECELMSNVSSTRQMHSESPFLASGGGSGSEIAAATTTAATSGGTKPKVLSIYEQYDQFGLDDDDLNFLKPADTMAPMLMSEMTGGSIFSQFRSFGITQSPGFGSSHSSSPYSTSMAP